MMKLTNRNYYGKSANQAFMSVSQFKQFQKCEAMALAELSGEYERPKSRAIASHFWNCLNCDTLINAWLADLP